jgi:hypothetical protein
MAKDRKHIKPETWIPLQEIYAAERARFHLPAPASNRPQRLDDMKIDSAVHDPAVRVVREKLKRQPYRYFDRDGVRHLNDLSDDFICRAVFHLDEGWAIWEGGFVRSKDVLWTSIDALMSCDGSERIDEQAAEAPSKQPAPMSRNWIVNPCDPQHATSYEEVVHRWEAYAIELLKVPAPITSAPALLPKRLGSKGVLIEEINRRKAAGEKLPRQSDLAHDLARWMMERAQKSGNDVKPLHWRTIANYLSKCGL